MKRINVKYLHPGHRLTVALYDQDGKLLLEKGNLLTEDMMPAFRDPARPFVFAGEWDPDEFKRMSTSDPLSEHRAEADGMVDELAQKIAQEVKAVELEPKAPGKGFESKINRTLKTKRSIEEVDHCNNALAIGARTISDIANGLINPQNVGKVATGVIDELMNIFADDGSLLNSLTLLHQSSEYVCVHAINTAVFSINIATAMGLDADQVREVGIGALLHNIGMSMVPEQIVNADHKLNNAEHVDVQKHIGYGVYLLEKFKGLPASTRIIMYQNKERADGTGYPKRLKRHATHLYARIVAVADVYDAITSERPWRPALHPYHAMEYLLTNARSKFDPDVVKGLLRYLSLFPVGSFVELSTGELAQVVHSNEDDFLKPVVSILRNQYRETLSPPQLVDLHSASASKIASVADEVPNLDDLAGFVY